mmetsp:Transcript_11027/g.19113  ORF Transcript_11027/g.19113 Transcript_11027/m.19113 type:complete len:93 (+) Transcript_11027:417-695(+)
MPTPTYIPRAKWTDGGTRGEIRKKKWDIGRSSKMNGVSSAALRVPIVSKASVVEAAAWWMESKTHPMVASASCNLSGYLILDKPLYSGKTLA